VILRRARPWTAERLQAVDLAVRDGRVASPDPARPGGDEPEADLGGRVLLPGLVNAHDHLDLSTFPPLGRPPYPSVYAWTEDVEADAGGPRAAAALAVDLTDRLFLGGLRNLLAGATAVAHHNAFHRALARDDFPVRVLSRYQFAHSPGLAPALRRTYRSTDRRIPWFVHVAEGTDERCRAELALLEEANVLRHNTVIVHGVGLDGAAAARVAAAGAAVVWCPEANRRLYGATADVATLRAAGVSLGLGSDSAASGARDPLSNLAAARAEGALPEAALLGLATAESAAVARLPAGGATPGEVADLVAVDSMEAWWEGERRTIALVMVAGRVLYGEPGLLDALGVRWLPISVDGAGRGLESRLARRAAALRRRHPALAEATWLRGVAFPPSGDSARPE
jgi:cytosine/adenosine deaminase-related metal-dependent hydrolase